MAWIYLLLAGLCEIGWPVGLKIAQQKTHLYSGVFIAIICIVASGAFLFLAQKTIHIGTAYAVWTGIGAVGTFFVGVLFFSDPASLIRFLGIAFIILGIVILKLAN